MADITLTDSTSQLRRAQKGTAQQTIFNANLTTSYASGSTVWTRGVPKVLIQWTWTKGSGTTLRLRMATSNDDTNYREVDVWETPSTGESTVYPHTGKIVAADHTVISAGVYGGVFEVNTHNILYFKFLAKSDDASGSLVMTVLEGTT